MSIRSWEERRKGGVDLFLHLRLIFISVLLEALKATILVHVQHTESRSGGRG